MHVTLNAFFTWKPPVCVDGGASPACLLVRAARGSQDSHGTRGRNTRQRGAALRPQRAHSVHDSVEHGVQASEVNVLYWVLSGSMPQSTRVADALNLSHPLIPHTLSPLSYQRSSPCISPYRIAPFILRSMQRGIYCTHWRHRPLRISLHDGPKLPTPLAPSPVGGTCGPPTPHAHTAHPNPTRPPLTGSVFTPPRSARSRPPPPPRRPVPRLPR